MKVSVLTTTYNQESFIAQTLDGALMQQTDFDFEIVVGEDCSTDGTRAIVQRYAEQHPDKIRALLRERNLGMHRNFLATYKACRGEWIAQCEGDDYWIAPDKLQRQIDFLTHHPDCTICFTNALVIYDNSPEEHLFCPPDQPEITDVMDLLQWNFIPTSAVMFRNKLMMEQVPEGVLDLMFGDWPLFLWQAQDGKIGYINEPLTVYRKHEGGIWSKADPDVRANMIIAMYNFINQYLNYKYDPIIKVLIGRTKLYGRLEKHAETLQRQVLEQAKRIEELEQERRALLQECERTRNRTPAVAPVEPPVQPPAGPDAAPAETAEPLVVGGPLPNGAVNIDYAFPIALPYLIVGGWLAAERPSFQEVALSRGQGRPIATPFHTRTEPCPEVAEALRDRLPADYRCVGFNLLIDSSGVDLPAVLHLHLEDGASYCIDLEPHLAVKVAPGTKQRAVRLFDPPRPAAVPH
jgi:glycosyltransferase involved in cell wall biosynthesis